MTDEGISRPERDALRRKPDWGRADPWLSTTRPDDCSHALNNLIRRRKRRIDFDGIVSAAQGRHRPATVTRVACAHLGQNLGKNRMASRSLQFQSSSLRARLEIGD
jgi:hypothetical protein